MGLVLWMPLGPRVASAHDQQADASIAALQARIDALEQRLQRIEAAGQGVPAASSASAPSPLTAQPMPASEAASQPDSATDDMARALERALVREGGLLLPPAAFEIEPRWGYQYRSSAGLALLAGHGQPQLAQLERRWNLQQAGVGVRVGLPSQLQLELLLPYARVRQSQTAAGSLSSSQSGSGFGASEVGLSWQLRSPSAGTGIVAGLRWIEPGSSVFERDIGLPLANGFQAWQASLLFVQRRDPLVLFGALSHAVRRAGRIAGHAVDPGDTTGLRAGAIIALSPDTSLRLGLELARTASARIDAAAAHGSSAVSGEFSTGFSFVLSPRILLGVEAGIGLTQSSPDFRIGLSLPVRF